VFWVKLFKSRNGICFLYHDHYKIYSDLRFFNNAAPYLGFGATFQDQWFSDFWPIEIEINLPSDLQCTAQLELYPIVVEAILWLETVTQKANHSVLR